MMRTQLALLLAVIGISVVANPRPGWTADPPTATQETTVMTDKARQLYEDGLSAHKRGQLLEAHTAYLAAWSLNKHWQIAANLADTEIDLGKYREAAEHAAYYKKTAPPNRREKAEALFQRASAHVGTLTIDVDVAGADVLIDDAVVGRAPLNEPVFVDFGPHKVTARLAGRPDATQPVTISIGVAQRVALRIPPEQDRSPRQPPPSPAPTQGPNRAMVNTGIVLGSLGVGVGIVLTAASAAKGSAANTTLAMLQQTGLRSPCGTHMTECLSIDSDRRGHDALAKGALGAFVGGGAIGLATLGYALLAPKTSAAVGGRVIPIVAQDRAGLALLGVW